MTNPNPAAPTIAPLRFITSPTLHIVGLRKNAVRNPGQDIPALWQRFVPALSTLPRSDTATFGVCMQTDGDNSCFDYLAGCAVAETAVPNAELTAVKISPQYFAVFAHNEHVSTIASTIDKAFREWLPRSGFESVLIGTDAIAVLEHYGAGFDPHSGTGDIEIWVPLRQ